MKLSDVMRSVLYFTCILSLFNHELYLPVWHIYLYTNICFIYSCMIASLHSFVYKQNFVLSTNFPLHTQFSAGLWLVLDLVLCRSTSLRMRSTRRRPLTTTRRRTEKRPLPKTWATTSTSWLHRSVPSLSPPIPTPSLPQRCGPQHLHPGYTGQSPQPNWEPHSPPTQLDLIM